MRCSLCKLSMATNDNFMEVGNKHFHRRCFALTKTNPDLADVLAHVGSFADQEWERKGRPGSEDKYKAYDTVRMHIWHLIR